MLPASTTSLNDRVSPFLGVGVGGETYDYDGFGLDNHSHWMGNVLAGLSFPIADRLALRLEARDCFARFDSGVQGVDDAWENDLMLTVGLGWRTPLSRFPAPNRLQLRRCAILLGHRMKAPWMAGP